MEEIINFGCGYAEETRENTRQQKILKISARYVNFRVAIAYDGTPNLTEMAEIFRAIFTPQPASRNASPGIARWGSVFSFPVWATGSPPCA